MTAGTWIRRSDETSIQAVISANATTASRISLAKTGGNSTIIVIHQTS